MFVLILVFWGIFNSRGRKDVLEVQNTDFSYRGQGFNSQHLHGRSQFSVSTI